MSPVTFGVKKSAFQRAVPIENTPNGLFDCLIGAI